MSDLTSIIFSIFAIFSPEQTLEKDNSKVMDTGGVIIIEPRNHDNNAKVMDTGGIIIIKPRKAE